MDIGHEVVEMGAPLVGDGCGREEHVHQHRLAATDGAVDIEAAKRALRPRAEQAGQRAPACGTGLGQLFHEAVETGDEGALRRIGGDAAVGDEGVIPRRHRAGRARDLARVGRHAAAAMP